MKRKVSNKRPLCRCEACVHVCDRRRRLAQGMHIRLIVALDILIGVRKEQIRNAGPV